jgi:hypothetical protein
MQTITGHCSLLTLYKGQCFCTIRVNIFKTARFSQRENVLIIIIRTNSGCLPEELELGGLGNGDAVGSLEGRTDIQGVSKMLGQALKSEFFTS